MTGSTNHAWKLALIDLDGTLYRGTRRIEGAAEFVQRLRNLHIRPVFFTNNSTRTPAQVQAKLRAMDIEAREDEICTSAQSSAAYVLRKAGIGKKVLYIGQDGLREALLASGLLPVHVRDCTPGDQQQPAAAVLGMDSDVSYGELATFCQAANRLQHFVLTNGDVRLPAEDRFLPGNGALGSFVSTATGIQPYLAGKPNPAFVRYALERYGVSEDSALVIGDNIETDIAVGNRAGLYAIQVRTGVTYHSDEAVSDSAACRYQPNQVVPSVAHLFLHV